ncbi:MAG: hypothetical protein SPL30_05915 [Succinivibrio sp.]|nr:hypothetical protein [Succinivibrio sp.]
MKLEFEIDDVWGGIAPVKAHPDDAGFDLAIPEDFEMDGACMLTACTGVHVLIPAGFYGLILPRSSMSARMVYCVTGVIDAGYTGEICVSLFNASGKRQTFKAGDRIAQLVLVPSPAFELAQGEIKSVKTERGAHGFGSSGR